MKKLLLLAAIAAAAPSAAALPCQLDERDYSSLAASKSKLDRAKVAALPPAEQKDVCDSRAFWKKVAALRPGKILSSVDDYIDDYLTVEENRRVMQAIDQRLKARLQGSGVQTRAQA